MFERYKIVAILTAYKRDYFTEQIDSLLEQTIKVDRIVIFNNGNLNLSHLKEKYGDKINLINSELNTKFWGRFAIANLFNTEYVLMLDDDTIPASRWIENCLRLSTEKNCIVTGNGRSIDNVDCLGDGGYVIEDTKIGFGGHSWFYKKEWLKYFITDEPLNYDTGEVTISDIRILSVLTSDGDMRVEIESEDEIISTVRNTILSIDENHPSSISTQIIAI